MNATPAKSIPQPQERIRLIGTPVGRMVRIDDFGDEIDPLQREQLHAYGLSAAHAVKVLQRLFTQMGFPCDDDGVVGPATIRAAQLAQEAAPDYLADAYAIARRNYYYALADARPASRKFARRKDGGKGGWIARAETFMAAKYRLTEAQHKAKVAAWG